MKPGNELFELIKSLNQTEKRFFKMYASRHVIGRKTSYSKLFDAIEKQNSYDEEKIIKKFKGQKIVKFFASEKYYLYNMVLDSLNIYHAESSVEYMLSRMLHFSEILYKKSLYEQCAKILERTEKIAWKYEQFFELQKILSKKRKLIYKNPFIKQKDVESLIENTFIDQEKVLESQRNVYNYDRLSQTIFSIYKKIGTVRKDEDLEKIKKIFSNPLLKDVTEAHSYDALRYFYSCHVVYNDVVRNDENNFLYATKLIEHAENNPERREENLEGYIASLNGFLIICVRLKKLKDFANTINKLKELNTLDKVKRSPDLQFRIFEAIVTHELDLHIKTADFENAIPLITEIEKKLTFFGENINKAHQITIYFNIVAIYFGSGKYREALRWLNRILNEGTENTREDVAGLVRIINLIIYFELNNILQLPYLLKSTFMYLSKRKRIYKFEGIMLKYVAEFLRTKDTSELPGIFKRLRDDLIIVKSDPYESIMFEDVNLIAWLDKKIEALQNKTNNRIK
ncbi:MAG: hypothetical protein H0W84_03080 [Bacteroidetes bacterium]|nr:hypothetical protein [Bacteroidota bacterium]